MDLITLLEENRHLTWEAEPGVGTDKGGYPGEHDFVKGYYNEAFKKYQDKEIDLLEIGVFGGASMALWSMYFPKANIIGLDIKDYRNEKYRDVERVKIGVCDAYLPETANQLGDFDIIIDDGYHDLEHMLLAIKLYLPKVRPGGVLVLEDIADTDWFPHLIEAVPKELREGIECIDLRENLGRWDDMLFVVNTPW